MFKHLMQCQLKGKLLRAAVNYCVLLFIILYVLPRNQAFYCSLKGLGWLKIKYHVQFELLQVEFCEIAN